MTRALCLAAGLLVASVAAADEIKLNVPFEGKFPSEPEEVRGAPGGGKGGTKVYRAALDVKLDEGQKPTVSVTAKGPSRMVAVVVLDKDGTPFATNLTVQKKAGPAALSEWKDAGASRFVMAAVGGGQRLGPTAKVEVPAAPVGGTYTVVILCNYPGEFVLEVKDPRAKPAVRDAAAIQREIEATKKRLAELEAELKAAGVGK
jgi:hypothetical protein